MIKQNDPFLALGFEEISKPESSSQIEFQPIEQSPKESFLQSGIRHTARTASRAGEVIAGLPGDIHAGLGHVAGYVRKKLSPITGESPEEVENIVQQRIEEFPLPTSEKLRKKSIELTKGYTEPKSEAESFTDELAQDFTSLISSGAGKTWVKGIKRAASLTGIGQAAKQTAKIVGGKESDQELAKSAAIFVSSLIDPKRVSNYWKDQYKKAENLIPQGALTEAKSLENNLLHMKKNLSKGTLAPSEKFVVDEIDKILPKISNGKIAPDEVQATIRSINEKIQGLYKEMEKGQSVRAKTLINDVNNQLSKTLENYGKVNPEYYQAYKNAQDAFLANVQSRKLSNLMSKHSGWTKAIIASPVAGQLFALNVPGAVSTAAGIGLGYSGLKSVEALTRMVLSSNKPGLRNLYLQTLNSALKENSPQFIRNLGKLDKEMRQDKDILNLLEEFQPSE